MTEESQSRAQSDAREQVYEAFADRTRAFGDAVETALTAGTRRLSVELGFLTRIHDGTQHIEYAVGDHDGIRPGQQCPLEEAYCRRTVATDGHLSVQDAQASAAVSEAAYDAFGLGSYIGCPVTADGEVYGTVCFADADPRATPFSEAEELFVELLAGLVGQAIERREHERLREERTAELRAEKRRLAGIAETSFDVLFQVGAGGRFTYVSQAAEHVLGYDPETLVGDEFTTYLRPVASVAAVDAYERVLAGEAVQGLQLTFAHRDGSDVVVEVNATPVVEDGEVTAIQGVGRDVTDRRDREARLRMQTRAMDEAEMPITIADATTPDNEIIYANRAFETVTGYTASQIRGRNCRILQGPETDPEAVATLRDGIENSRSVTTELVNYRRDGTPFWSRVTVTPIANDDGVTTHYVGFQQDVTDRKRTAQLIGLLNRVLRHNLRNELTVIHGYTEFVEERPEDVDVVSGIRRPVKRLVALSERAHELETYARRDRKPERLWPCDIVETVAEAHRERFPEATVRVDVDADCGVCVGREIERAVSELVTNALEHAPSSDTAVDVRVRRDGEWVEIAVADDGPGIPEIEATVVETGEETPLQHGTGLGLWLVNWIVTQYGGSFQLAGDDGTVATLRLPAIEDGQSVADAARRPTVLFR
ncbi:PAS domain S-box protein [Haloarcula marina]|uniref:PAS domain S-box protein n=1 Tax=Haloarcula marina TaxID=2961574 RepID=UPI0020B896D7|nr:PAS domain S-box protein [Halomicroarcula marina]